MANNDYAAALKRGRRRYQEAVSSGSYPYLPALDDALSYTEIASEVDMGLVDVPLHKIIGTKTEGRTNAFADNFMPLLPERSEFGMKWAALFDHQVIEGIREAIVVYEFMGQFYVQEGNKRVSVLKYLGAYSIPGRVTRIVPKKTDDKNIRLYYEFMEFYQVSFNYDIWFSKEGSYKKLLEIMGKEPGAAWDEEERLLFRSAFGRFSKAYDMTGGEKLSLTASDAFLIYTEIFSYDEVKGQTEREMSKNLRQSWQEIRLAAEGGSVDLVEQPEETESKSKLFDWLVPPAVIEPEMLKAAFLYAKTAETSGWTYAHELGRMHVVQAFGGRFRTMVFDQVNTDEQIERAIGEAIAAGCDIIFATSPQMVGQCVRSAILHPQIRFFVCSINQSYSSVCTYYGRMYESKFLMGAIAAAMSDGNRLGYVADYPIYGVIANINAFALGARMINPRVEVHLEWSRIKEQNAEGRLEEAGISFISGNDIIVPERASRAYGLYVKESDGSYRNLATPIWHWGKFYERIIRMICSGSAGLSGIRKSRAVNYWWGMSADVIDVICSENMPPGTHRLIDFLNSSIRAGSFHPFDGLIYSQNGVIRCKAGESLSPEEIITMNWLAENVVGTIPKYEELTEEAQELMRFQGIVPQEKESGER